MILTHKEETTMTNYDYLIIGGGMSAAAAIDGIRELGKRDARSYLYEE